MGLCEKAVPGGTDALALASVRHTLSFVAPSLSLTSPSPVGSELWPVLV